VTSKLHEILDEYVKRSSCIARRATTCWKAHREGEMDVLLVMKDSWQYLGRDEEGIFLQEASETVLSISSLLPQQSGLMETLTIYLHTFVKGSIWQEPSSAGQRAVPPTVADGEAVTRMTRSIGSNAKRKGSSSRAGIDALLPFRKCSYKFPKQR
jgi:hypothetical protein